MLAAASIAMIVAIVAVPRIDWAADISPAGHWQEMTLLKYKQTTCVAF